MKRRIRSGVYDFPAEEWRDISTSGMCYGLKLFPLRLCEV